MMILHLTAFFTFAIVITDYFRSTILRTIPVLLCTISLVLYGLAFFNQMEQIDLIAIIVFILSLFYFQHQRKRSKEILTVIFNGYFWAFLLLSIILFNLLQFRQVLEWDAYNFWATDIKSLFYLNGFADKYCNVAPDFGDYPPAVQMILWWFLHLCSTDWNEGIIFGGYILLGAAFLFRLVSTFQTKKQNFIRDFLIATGLGLLAILLPGVVDTSWYRSLYMDPIMAMTYGTLLCTAIEYKKEPTLFSKISAIILIAFLTLTKSIGFLWAIFAAIFFFIWNPKTKNNTLFTFGSIGIIGLSYGSWAIYCKIMERTTYLTESISSTAGSQIEELLNGTFLSNPINGELCKSFFSAFFGQPMHLKWTTFIDLTPIVFFILLGLFFFILYKANYISPKEYITISLYAGMVSIFTYLMLLTAHLTIFIGETAYLEPTKMIEQMTRYSSPVTIGFLILALHFIAVPTATKQKQRSKGISIVIILLILSSTCYCDVLNCFVEGHDPLNENRTSYRNDVISNYNDYIEETQTIPLSDPHRRVLICTTVNEEFYRKNCIVSYMVSPVSMMYYEQYSENSYPDICNAFQKSHAGYLYITECTETTLNEWRKSYSDFQTKTLYKATYQNNKWSFIEAE